MIKVQMYESKRGWVSNVFYHHQEFETCDAAKAFVREYNQTHNSSPVVPDYYIKALEPECVVEASLDDVRVEVREWQ
jgi:hypothetical protein